MPAGGPETERLQPLLRDLGRVDLREPEGLHASRAELREQLLQTRSTVLDERVERYNLRLLHSARHVKEVGLDSLVGGDGESCDVVLPCRERLDRALPAHLRMSLSEEAIGGEIVNRDRDHEPVDSRRVSHARSGPRRGRRRVEDVVCQDRFLDISACAEQLAGRHESLGDLDDDSRGTENRELRAERGEQVTAMTLSPMIRMDGDLVDERTRKAAWRRSGRRSGRSPRRRPCSCCTRPEGRGSTA